MDEGEVEGVSLCHNGPKISHLIFVDNNLLFCQAQIEDINTIQEILGKYEKASGQKTNSEKKNLFFSKGVPESSKDLLKNLLGVPKIKEYEKYLELPAVVGKRKKASLNYIKDRVWSKLQGWKEKLLS